MKLAKLSRLKLTDEEVERFGNEISAILGYVEQLKNVDVSGLEPTTQVTGLKNVMRPDEIKDYGATTEELLKNVPNREGNYIKVKRVLT